jgi:GINS complex subunit 2
MRVSSYDRRVILEFHDISRLIGSDINQSEMTQNFTYEEIEFLAQDDLVEIIPMFKCDEMNLVQGSFGPFEVNVPIEIPLWVALTLRKRGKCKLVQPNWLTAEHLQNLITKEKESGQEDLSEVPYHFFVHSLMLLAVSNQNGSDFQKSDTIRLGIEDLLHYRDQKIQRGLLKLEEPQKALELLNHTVVEVVKYREIITKCLNILDKMK